MTHGRYIFTTVIIQYNSYAIFKLPDRLQHQINNHMLLIYFNYMKLIISCSYIISVWKEIFNDNRLFVYYEGTIIF